MSSDTVTVLTSLSHPLTKTIVKTETGMVTRTSQNVRFYKGDEIEVDGIRSFAALLEKISANAQKCVVRGAIAPGTNRARMLRRKFPKPDAGEVATLLEVPHHWLLCDFDGVELPPGFDPFANPPHTARFVASKLPECFRDASLWYQFTAGAGIKPGLHIRLGFWLDRPLGEDELKRWLAQKVAEQGRSRRSWFREYPVDPAFFGTAQPNYIAAPIIGAGATDPLTGRCNRSGFVAGDVDTVSVPHIEPRPERSATSGPSSTTEGGLTFAESLAAIGDHEGGQGCHTALRYAVALYWRFKVAEASPETLKRLLEARIADADWDAVAHSAEYLRNEIAGLDRLIDSIRGQQRESDRLEEEERTRAICPWPEAGLSLAEAEPILRRHVDQFFGQAVPEGIAQREEYEAALELYKEEVEARRRESAEVEFGLMDADELFADIDPDQPEAPRYAQHGIRITAGAGKTHAAIARIVADVETDGRSFVYSVPNHAKAEEVSIQLNEMAGAQIASVWQGIDRDDPSSLGAKMCRRAEMVKAVVKSSGSITDACGSPGRGFCPFHPAAGGPCAYRRQANEKPKVWVITHPTLATQPQPSMDEADALVVDEALGLGSYREDDLPLADFASARKVPSPLDGILTRVQRALGRVAPGTFVSRAPFEEEGVGPDLCDVALRCEAYGFERVAKAFSPASEDDAIISQVEAAGEANRYVLTRQAFWRALRQLLGSDDATSARMKMLPGEGAAIRIVIAVRPHPRWLERPVLHIDATLDPTIGRTWLPRLEMLADIRVEKGEGVIVQQIVDEKAVSYGRIIPGAGADKSAAKRSAQESNLKKIMRKIEVSAATDRHQAGATGCVVPKELEDQMEANWTLWGTRPANLGIVHFGDLRGRNNLENCRRLIVISRQEPQAREIERLVRAEFGRHPSPELAEGYYPARPIALRTGGNSRSVVKEAYHPDRSAGAVLRQIRDAEVAQAVHRARPVRRGKDRPLVIEIVSGVPVDIAVDSTGTFDDWLDTSPADLLLARGMWSDFWGHKQAVLFDLYPTAQAVRRGFQENLTASALRDELEPVIGGKGAQGPYKDTLIRRLGSFADAVFWPSYRYRVDGDRRSHVVAIDPSLHKDARSAWAARLGKSLAIFEQIERPAAAELGAPGDQVDGPPIIRLQRAPSIVSDIFGINRRDPAAPPLPAAPLHVRTHAGHVRFWADGGEGQPIVMRSKPAPTESRAPAEPLLTIEAISRRLGISSFALKNAMGRSRYRKLAAEDRDRAAIRWMTLRVGRDQFLSAVRSLADDIRRGTPG